MSVAINVLTNGTQAYGAPSSFSTASISPAANRLLLLCISCEFGHTWSISGNGLTWDLVASANFSASYVYIFRAMSDTTPSSGAISATGSFSDVFDWTVLSVQGVKTGANGANAIVQSPSGTGSNTAVSVTLAAFASANNATLLVSSGLAASAATGTVGSGFTELVDQSAVGTSPYYMSQYVEWKNSNDTTADYTASTTVVYSALGLELAEGGITKTLSNSRSTSASVARVEGAVRTNSNSRASSASLTRIEGAVRSASRTGAITAAVAEVQSFVRALSNSRSAAASLARRLTARRTLTNSRAGTNATQYSFQRNRNPINSLSTSAVMSRAGSTFKRAPALSKTFTASLSDLKGAFKNLTTSIATSTSVTRLGEFHITLSNARATLATLIRQATFPRALSRGGSITSTVVRVEGALRSLSNSISSSFEVDQATPLRGRLLSNSRSSSASVARREGAVRSISNSRSSTFSMTRQLGWIRSFASSISTSASVVRAHGQFKRIGQHRNSGFRLKKLLGKPQARVGTIASSVVFRKGYYRILTFSGSLTAATSRTITLAKTIYETKGFIARLQVVHGFVQTDLSPLVTSVARKVSTFGIFFRPRDPGYDD